jgi:hypothetical protein
LLHGGFALFNSPNVGHARPLIQEPRQFVQLLGGTDRIDLHPAVVLIPDPPAEAEAIGFVLHEPAKSHSLYATGYEPAARCIRHSLSSMSPLRSVSLNAPRR